MNLNKIKVLFIKQIVYTQSAFFYLIKKNKFKYIFDIQFDQLNYYNPKIAPLFDEYLKSGNSILLLNSKRLLLAKKTEEIHPKLYFYCKDISRFENINDLKIPQTQVDLKSELLNYKNLNSYSSKILFGGLVKGHTGYRKKIIE